MPTESLGQRIRRARQEVGISGTALARLIGKSQPYVSDLERGQRTPSLDTLHDLARALGQPLSYFFAEHEPVNKKRPQRPPSTTAVVGVRHSLAELIADQLQQARLLQQTELPDREQLVRVVEQAIDNAYHDLHRVLREQRQQQKTIVG